MIRMFEYEPRVDTEGNSVEAYRDFQNYLFSHPYGFVWNFPADRVTIQGVAYRISSLQQYPGNTVGGSVHICNCCCGGGNGGNGGGSITQITTDVSLHGAGSEADPLGVQLSQQPGNRLQILHDGCYVGGDPPAYTPPEVVLSSSIPEGEYLLGESLQNMELCVTVTAGTESIRDVRILAGNVPLHVFPLVAGSHVYTFILPEGVDRNLTFMASVSDGENYISNSLHYTFVPPVYCGVSGTMNVTEAKILAETPFRVPGSSFEYVYASFKRQHIWMACPASREIKNFTDENGLNITAAFKRTDMVMTVAGIQTNYSLYVFDTKTTGSDYKITFQS